MSARATTYGRSVYLDRALREEVDRAAADAGLTVGTYLAGLVRAAIKRGLKPIPSERAMRTMAAFESA